MSTAAFEMPSTGYDYYDEIDELISLLAVTDDKIEYVAIIDAALHLYMAAVVEVHGSFSSLDIAHFTESIAEGEVPLLSFAKRGTSIVYKRRLSEAKERLLRGAAKSTTATEVSFGKPLDCGEVAESVSAVDSEDTIKGTSQRSVSTIHTPKNDTPNFSASHCGSTPRVMQEVLKMMPAEWLPPENQIDAFGLEQDDIASAGEQDAEAPSRKLDALQTILASYAEEGAKVTAHFSARAIRAMRARYEELDLTPILTDGDRVMMTVMMVEEGMEMYTGEDLYEIRKQLFERFESAFSAPMRCIWKLEFVPKAKTKMVRKHATEGYAHLHFYLSEPKTRSAHSRKSKFSKDFNGMSFRDWFEATIRDITGTPAPKKRSMTHYPKPGERGEYPEKYEDAVNQMACYWAKAGKDMREKQIQNYVPLMWLRRGGIHLKFWGDNALALQKGA